MNDLLNLNIDAKLLCSTDNTVTLLKEKYIEYKYNKANLVFKMGKLWFDNNCLELNLGKTKHFVSDIQNIVVKNDYKIINHSGLCIENNFINCKDIGKVDSIKYLGLHLDNQLKWKIHIDYAITIIRKHSYISRNIRNLLDLHNVINV